MKCQCYLAFFGLLAGLGLAGCAPRPPAATPTPLTTPTTAGPVVMTTALGDLVVIAARLVDEANGVKAGADERLLLVIVTHPGEAALSPDTFSLEAFQQATAGQLSLVTDAGGQSPCTMAGWVDGEFAMGFRVPAAAASFSLQWPGNAPLAVHPEK